MTDGDDLVSDTVVETVGRVGVDEAVSDPDTSADALREVLDDLEGVVDAVRRNFGGLVEGSLHGLAVVLEDVERRLRRDRQQLS